jgi:hypothetical protein
MEFSQILWVIEVLEGRIPDFDNIVFYTVMNCLGTNRDAIDFIGGIIGCLTEHEGDRISVEGLAGTGLGALETVTAPIYIVEVFPQRWYRITE